jgi:hypothetical protein
VNQVFNRRTEINAEYTDIYELRQPYRTKFCGVEIACNRVRVTVYYRYSEGTNHADAMVFCCDSAGRVARVGMAEVILAQRFSCGESADVARREVLKQINVSC